MSLSSALSTGPEGVDSRLPTSTDAAHAAAMSKIDGCPECVLNTEPPRSAVTVDNGWRCAYLCSDCGHAWTTDWAAESAQLCGKRVITTVEVGAHSWENEASPNPHSWRSADRGSDHLPALPERG